MIQQSPAETALPMSQDRSGAAPDSIFPRIEKLAVPIAICVSLLAFFRCVAYSSRRLYFDEIYTCAVALQPTWHEVWKAYWTGLDYQSLLFYGVTRLSWSLLGHNELALRMPEILGVLLFAWCMFFVIGRRMGPLLGLSALVLPLVTNLVFFSGQARPYGILSGAWGLSLLAWRNAVGNPRRHIALPLFAASLALVVACHAYAIVVVPIFAIAEIYRLFRSRHADWPLWTCFLAAFPPLIPYWLQMRIVTRGDGVLGAWHTAHWSDIVYAYQSFFEQHELFLIVAGMLVVGLFLLRKGPRSRKPGLPGHEIAILMAVAAAPLFSLTLAMMVTRYYVPRYAIFAVGGIVALLILLIDAMADRRVVSLIMLFMSLFLFGYDHVRAEFDRDFMQKRDMALQVPFASVPRGMPLVIASGNALLPADLYGSGADLSNSYYLLNRDLCLKYTGNTFFQFGHPLTDYHHFRVHLVDYYAFTREHRKFMVYAPSFYPDDWQIRKLQDDGARIVEKGKYDGEYVTHALFEVTLP